MVIIAACGSILDIHSRSWTNWEATTDEAKFHIGMVLEGYNTNLHHAKYTLGEQFFQAVSGNQFRSQHDREALVAALIDTLAEKHGGWNNFHHEPPVMDSIFGYVRTTNDILPAFADKLIKTTVMCRIGRGTSYCQGVSSRGLPLYEMLLKMLGDQWAAVAIYSLTHYDIQHRLGSPVCRTQAKAALQAIRSNTVTPRTNECLDFLINNIEGNGKVVFDSRFKQLSSTILKWS